MEKRGQKVRAAEVFYPSCRGRVGSQGDSNEHSYLKKPHHWDLAVMVAVFLGDFRLIQCSTRAFVAADQHIHDFP